MTGTTDFRAPVEHLDADALSGLRTMLLLERTSQAAAGEEHASTATELTGQTDVDSLLERELAEASATRAYESLADIDDALRRIDDGTYGWCESCGQPIARERLEVLPHARLCVACASGSGALLPGATPRPATLSSR